MVVPNELEREDGLSEHELMPVKEGIDLFIARHVSGTGMVHIKYRSSALYFILISASNNPLRIIIPTLLKKKLRLTEVK